MGAGHAEISGETPTKASPDSGQVPGAGADQLARQIAGARVGVGNQVHAGLVQVLAESFVVGEDEGLVLLHRAAQRAAELVARETRDGTAVEEIARIESIVAQELVKRSVELVGSGLGDNEHLRAGPLAELRAVGIAQHIEFAYRIHAQQLLAGAARLHIVLGRAGEFDAIQQEEILLRPVSRNREVIAGGRIGDADSARFFPREVHHSGIEREQLVVASAVERQILDLPVRLPGRRYPRW